MRKGTEIGRGSGFATVVAVLKKGVPPVITLKAATLLTSVLASVFTIGKLVSSYVGRPSTRRRVQLERDPIGIQEPLVGALERADSLQARPKTEAEALAQASAWTTSSTSEPSPRGI